MSDQSLTNLAALMAENKSLRAELASAREISAKYEDRYFAARAENAALRAELEAEKKQRRYGWERAAKPLITMNEIQWAELEAGKLVRSWNVPVASFVYWIERDTARKMVMAACEKLEAKNAALLARLSEVENDRAQDALDMSVKNAALRAALTDCELVAFDRADRTITLQFAAMPDSQIGAKWRAMEAKL